MKKEHFIFFIAACFLVALCAAEKNSYSAVKTVCLSPYAEKYTLIIDPGHGGADGGAVSVTGKKESEINLDIALKCEQIAAFCGIEPIMTRLSEDISYEGNPATIKAKKIADQRARVKLINSSSNPFLISIHQNKYTSPGPSGVQTFYGNGDISAEFGAVIQENLSNKLNSDNSRPAVKIPDKIYLFKNIACPAVLVECGFISNNSEAELLENNDYQIKLSTIIIGTYSAYIR